MASKGKFSESNRQSLFEIQRGQTVSGVEARIIHAAGKRIHRLKAEVAARDEAIAILKRSDAVCTQQRDDAWAEVAELRGLLLRVYRDNFDEGLPQDEEIAMWKAVQKYLRRRGLLEERTDASASS